LREAVEDDKITSDEASKQNQKEKKTNRLSKLDLDFRKGVVVLSESNLSMDPNVLELMKRKRRTKG
jgi:hypothetical protein